MKRFFVLLLMGSLCAGELDTKIEEAMRSSGIEALGVAVVSEYKIAWAHGYGKTINGDPVSQRSTFCADDLSMPLTGMAALRAVQDGNLSLSRDINTSLLYWKIPETKKTRQRKVTLRNLLEHTSGLRGNNLDEARIERVPGRHVEVNALGYEVIRLALIDRYKDSFARVMHRILFEPLGMKQSMYDTEDNRFITTTLDVSKWLISLQKSVVGLSERLLTKKMAKRMITPRIDDEHAIGFIASRNAFGKKAPHGKWFMTIGSSSLVLGNAEGDGIVILSDGKGDLLPILEQIAAHKEEE